MHEVHIHGWSDLARLVDQHKSENWLYRGVTRSGPNLVPKVGRKGYDENKERVLLEEFKRQARSMLSVPPVSDLEWMALAQHHGLNTRLLDWTENVLIAAFFATESGITTETDLSTGEKSKRYPIIYGVRDLPMVAHDADPFALDEVHQYRPAHHVTLRIKAQQATFTIHPRPNQVFENSELVRWILEIDETLNLKSALDASGFTRASLFPGIDGIAVALNWQDKWNLLLR